MTGIPVITDKQRLTLPYMGGIYLAVNAIGGARIVVDGPMCAFYKAEFIQGNHQLVADLQRLASPHRVLHTELDIHRVILADEGIVHRKVQMALEDPETRVLFFSAMSSAMLIGRDINRMLQAATEHPEIPKIPVPSRSLSEDWVGGWSRTLTAIADAIPLDRKHDGSAKTPRVGIVGNMFLRHEGDSRGDVQELVRMVEALGATVASIWLAGGDWDDLTEIAQADLLVALPYGRAAAGRLGKRLGVQVVEVPLPFSWTLTERFLLGVAKALDRVEMAHAFLESEKRRWATELLVRAEQTLQGTRWVVVDDPVRVAGWLEIAKDVGAQVLAVGLTAAPEAGSDLDAPERRAPFTLLQEILVNRQADIFVSNSLAARYAWTASLASMTTVEFGYPCFERHPVVPTPSLGLVGEVSVVEIVCEQTRLDRRRRERGPRGAES